jgi:alpha-tubulin suppressor-like RCC1 family protein
VTFTYVFGNNTYGQLGIKTTGNKLNVPFQNPALNNIMKLASGYYHTLVLQSKLLFLLKSFHSINLKS